MISLWSVGVSGLLWREKSKPVVGTREVVLCARLKSLIAKKKKFEDIRFFYLLCVKKMDLTFI